MRGTLRYHVASTGRWTGSRFQPQNLKRPKIKDLDTAITAILTGHLERIRELGNPLTVVSDISRGLVCAAPGHVLIGADFSAVESRVLAWLAGEEWKIANYRRFDATGDPQNERYCVMASKALRRAVTPDDEVGRGFGKTYDLAFGFGGGGPAWRRFDPLVRAAGRGRARDTPPRARRATTRERNCIRVCRRNALSDAAIRPSYLLSLRAARAGEIPKPRSRLHRQ